MSLEKKSLADLRGRMEEAERQYPSLRVDLACGKPSSYVLAKTMRAMIDGFCSFVVDRGTSPWTHWRYWFYENRQPCDRTSLHAAVQRFDELAQEANIITEGFGEASGWIARVYQQAWAPVPGSPLWASKVLPAGHMATMERRRGHKIDVCWEDRLLDGWDPERDFVSTLAPFRASIFMIDVLLVADDLVGAPKAKVMLTERQQQALDFISNAKDPVSGKEIARHFGVDPGTVFAHYIPALKKHFGVKNRKGRGYYLPKE